MKWDLTAATVTVVIIVGQQLYDLWFHPSGRRQSSSGRGGPSSLPSSPECFWLK